MKGTSYQIEGMTIAVTHMEQMLEFYRSVFNIEFTEQKMYNSSLYSGELGGLKLLFCPAEIARNTAQQNRHQLDIIVSDLAHTIKTAKQSGGSLMGEIVEDKLSKSVGIYDPDKNSILFKQLKN